MLNGFKNEGTNERFLRQFGKLDFTYFGRSSLSVAI